MISSLFTALTVFFLTIALWPRSALQEVLVPETDLTDGRPIRAQLFAWLSRFRRKSADVALENFLGYLVSALRSGKTLLEAFDSYSGDDFFRRESRIIAEMVRRGMRFDEAFRARQRAIRSDGIETISYVIQSIYELGSPGAASALEAITAQLRENRLAQEKVRAKTGGKKVQIILLLVFPLLFLLLLSFSVDGYLSALLARPWLIGVSGFLIVLSWLWMYRMVCKATDH